MTFSEAIARGMGTITLRSVSATGTIVESFDAATSKRLTLSGSTLTIDPTNDLVGNTQYFVLFTPGNIKDAAGNAYAGISTYDFKTASIFNGTANNDTLTGTIGADPINGLAGNDIITGGTGTDIMNGAEFADTGASGIDEVRFTSAIANATLTLFAGDTGIEQAVIGTGTASAAVTTATTALNINAAALSYGLALIGNAGTNTLTGGSGADSLQGDRAAGRWGRRSLVWQRLRTCDVQVYLKAWMIWPVFSVDMTCRWAASRAVTGSPALNTRIAICAQNQTRQLIQVSVFTPLHILTPGR
ncbi:MAG: hypothetical protein CFE34_20220 [Rhodobacteraceae bacterium PARR1]|nr:MAG: hypothetical protein CFE34_20220 [Rhodobacteraceae bacterium PARR1]